MRWRARSFNISWWGRRRAFAAIRSDITTGTVGYGTDVGYYYFIRLIGMPIMLFNDCESQLLATSASGRRRLKFLLDIVASNNNPFSGNTLARITNTGTTGGILNLVGEELEQKLLV